MVDEAAKWVLRESRGKVRKAGGWQRNGGSSTSKGLLGKLERSGKEGAEGSFQGWRAQWEDVQ